LSEPASPAGSRSTTGYLISGPLKPLTKYILDDHVDPEQMKRAWDKLLSEAEVAILHHALCAGAIVKDGQIKGVLVETVTGRQITYE